MDLSTATLGITGVDIVITGPLPPRARQISAGSTRAARSGGISRQTLSHLPGRFLAHVFRKLCYRSTFYAISFNFI